MKKVKVIIVGAGAAGIAAATRLVQYGFNDFIILEAKNRIGGRINSVDFGKCIVDLGAQWCHGEKDNIVYNLAKQFNVLGSSTMSYNDFTFYESKGSITKEFTDKLLEIMLSISYDEKSMKNTEESFGKYFTDRYIKQINDEFGTDEEKVQLAMEALEWYHKFILCLDAPPTWFDLSAKGLTHYKECDGDLYLHWKNYGYKTIFDILLNKFPNNLEQSPIENKLYLNKEVCKITWKSENIENNKIIIHCQDGSLYTSDHALITLPLGVLKKKDKGLFVPELPENKQNAIKGLGFGTVNKIMIKFPNKWWRKASNGFSLLWSESDRQNVLLEFPHGPCENGKSWLESILGFYPIDNHSNILIVWVVGKDAPKVEELSDDIIISGCMYLIKKFLGRFHNICEPSEIIRSAWNSDPHFYGSYSYRSVESDKRNVFASNLSEPIVIDKKEILLFAGEATHSHYFSTVHGAIETGYRESDRILNIYRENGINNYKIIIVGAGMAGLGTAYTLFNNGCKDFAILEAQSKPGGRIKTLPLENGIIELGAQWLHGSGNWLYEFAKHHNLLSTVTSEEGLGIYVRDDGYVYDESLVKEVDFEIGKILQKCEEFVNCTEYPCSVGDFLQEEFLRYLKSTHIDPDLLEKKLELFNWHVKFQTIDNSCCTLKEISAKDWGRYFCIGSNGQEHINFRNGYESLVAALVHSLPDNVLNCDLPVLKIMWKNTSSNKIEIKCLDGQRFFCDHVIVTTSLGVLKTSASRLFLPELPIKLKETIASMGFYGIGKIFLIFEYKWWDTDGFQLMWTRKNKLIEDDHWTQYISGFDLVYNQPNVLLGWIGGKGLEAMEKLPEEQVGLECVELLRQFLKTDKIPNPFKTIRSTWISNPWIRGGYSFTTPECDGLAAGPATLAEPVFDNEIPKILLAGEACSTNHFSTTHGALESGQKQAQFLLDFLNLR